MNLKTILTFISISTALLSFGQIERTVARPIHHSERWLPINNFDAPQSTVNEDGSINAAPPLTNVIDNVSFYSQENSCNEQAVIFMKIININAYPVDVEWQTKPDGPTVSVHVPARKNVQGDCHEEDENLIKLIVPVDEYLKEHPKYIYTQIKVKK